MKLSASSTAVRVLRASTRSAGPFLGPAIVTDSAEWLARQSGFLPYCVNLYEVRSTPH